MVETIATLPEPDFSIEANFWNLLKTRRSRRRFQHDGALGIETLSRLLWACQGCTMKRGRVCFRTAPSAGALYPIETYVSIRSTDGLTPGIYRFRPEFFDLTLVRQGDFSNELARAAMSQSMIAHAQTTFIWTSVQERALIKYGQRAQRYIFLEAGHIAQNLSIAAEAESLGCCMVGAFYDDLIDALLGLDEAIETSVYLAVVGVSG